MDLNLIRSAVTVISFLVFLGIFAWAFGRRRRDGFDAAARLPFLDDARGAGVLENRHE